MAFVCYLEENTTTFSQNQRKPEESVIAIFQTLTENPEKTMRDMLEPVTLRGHLTAI